MQIILVDVTSVYIMRFTELFYERLCNYNQYDRVN